jgi:uncharacterized membrane protein
MSPTIAIHMAAALGAVAIGPFVLWARLQRNQRPLLHRSLGYAFITLMLMAAVSAIFIRDFGLPNFHGYTLVHLLVPYLFIRLWWGFMKLTRGDIRGHRLSMLVTYATACLVPGALTLLPNRYLGQLVWNQWLGLV